MIAPITDNTQLLTQNINSDDVDKSVKIYTIIAWINTALQMTGVYHMLFGNVLHIKKQATVSQITLITYPII